MTEYGDESQYSQRKVDVIDLKNGRFTTVPLEPLQKRDMQTDAPLEGVIRACDLGEPGPSSAPRPRARTAFWGRLYEDRLPQWGSLVCL